MLLSLGVVIVEEVDVLDEIIILRPLGKWLLVVSLIGDESFEMCASRDDSFISLFLSSLWLLLLSL